VGGPDGASDFQERVRAHTQAYERRLIEDALAAAGGNQTEAARRLRVPIRTLTHKMQQLGIRRPGRGAP
jgi:DNA-binding NtrC family response regulator